MDNLEQNTAIANEPREEINADLAVGMVNSGFHVFIDTTDEQLTYDMVFNHRESFDYDSHTFTAPMMEVAQYGAVEALCEKFDSLNDDVSFHSHTSLKDYADELFYFQERKDQFLWRDGRSEWENIRDSILSGKTEYLRYFLDDNFTNYPDMTDLLEDLNDYETTYLKEGQKNRLVLYRMEQGDDIRYYKAAKDYSIDDILKAANGRIPYLNLMDMGERISIDEYATIQQSDKFAFSVEMNFDSFTANIYEVNGGKGGIAEDDRTKDNVRFTDIKISEYVQSAKQKETEKNSMDKTYAYGAVYTVVMLDIGTEERKNAVSEALKSTINKFDEKNAMSQPYKNLLEDIKPETEFLHAIQGHLSCLKYALRYAETNKELCLSMLESIKHSEKNPKPVIIIKGYDCFPTDAWEDHGVTYNIGQSVKNLSFYYARATDGNTTRDYEYDYEPSREKVMIDHAGKLSEEYMDRYEAEHGADGYRAFPDSEARAENIRQMQDISHKTNNAYLSAAIRGERQDTMSNTKMECTGMVMLAEDSKAKAVATVTINDEFVIKGIKVYDGTNGLFAAMPSRKSGNEYQDVIFPITKDAREQMNNAVMEAYGKLAESGLDKLPIEKKEPPEKSTSKITVTLHQLDDEKTKAVGQIVIDDCIVVSGVKVRHGTNTEGVEKDFVSMPSYQTQTGDYNEYAHAVTKDCREKINKAVLGAYETLQKTEFKGVKLSELGEKGEVSSKYGMNNQFAAKLMAELDKKGIPYSAKVAESTALSVKKSDKATVDAVQKDLSAALTTAKKAEQQTAPKKAR